MSMTVWPYFLTILKSSTGYTPRWKRILRVRRFIESSVARALRRVSYLFTANSNKSVMMTVEPLRNWFLGCLGHCRCGGLGAEFQFVYPLRANHLTTLAPAPSAAMAPPNCHPLVQFTDRSVLVAVTAAGKLNRVACLIAQALLQVLEGSSPAPACHQLVNGIKQLETKRLESLLVVIRLVG